MRKIFLIIIFVLILSGCKKEEYFNCKIDLYNDIQEYELNAIYKVYHDGSFVTKVEKEEKYISNNEETLDYFFEYKNLEYQSIESLYGGITYNVDLKEDKVIMTSNIDMTITNIKKMIQNKYIDKDYVVSNKLTISGIKKRYEEKGAICGE